MATVDTTQALAQVLATGLRPDGGELKAIFVRPKVDGRQELLKAQVSTGGGVVGDRWSTRDPRTQITLINFQILDCFAEGDRTRWQLCGDQLVVDLDLSESNLAVGKQLRIGEAVLEVTEVPHTGCSKFSARYGADALAFINDQARGELHLRGIYVKVITEGEIRVGQTIEKL
jgi:hypothetical protein